MTRSLLGIVLGSVFLASLAGAGQPFRPGFPPCMGGELGFWQVWVDEQEEDGKTIRIARLALTTVDLPYIEPSSIICWVGINQLIQAGRNPAITQRPNHQYPSILDHARTGQSPPPTP